MTYTHEFEFFHNFKNHVVLIEIETTIEKHYGADADGNRGQSGYLHEIKSVVIKFENDIIEDLITNYAAIKYFDKYESEDAYDIARSAFE